MIREVKFRCVIQRNDSAKNKYYPPVVSFSTTDEIGGVPDCTIEIVTNAQTGAIGYVSPARVDDIIRLQVAERYKPSTPFVWVDIFEGTVISIDVEDGTKNTSVLNCRGHIDEASWTLIEETKAYTSATDAITLLDYFVDKYKRRLEYNALYADGGVTFLDYDTTAYQTFMSDLFAEAEKNSGHTYFMDVIPVYDENQNLSNVNLSWSKLPTVPTTSYKIVRGTSRYISSKFASSIEELVTYYRVLGDTPPATTPDVHVNAPWSDSFSGTTSASVASTGNNTIASAGTVVINGPGTYTVNVSGTKNISVAGSDSSIPYSGNVGGNAQQTILGSAVSPNGQYTGAAINQTMIDQGYGKRGLVETFTWLKSNNQCLAIATGVLADIDHPVLAGSATIIGTPQARKGDLVTVKLSATEINGATIDGTFTVYRVAHSGNSSGFTTNVDLGRVVRDAYDYIGKISQTVKTVKKNQCRG